MAEYPSRDTITIPLTGDPEEDLLHLDRAVLQDRRIAEGVCPNGCAPLQASTPFAADCAVCGFHSWSNTPHNLPCVAES